MLSFFPLDVFGEIWDLIESVSEGFLTYFWLLGNANISSHAGAPVAQLVNCWPTDVAILV